MRGMKKQRNEGEEDSFSEKRGWGKEKNIKTTLQRSILLLSKKGKEEETVKSKGEML